MDGIGAEVSLKIRSAIKAKLMELGAYVDEELPDYIMVMVANKRSREQMEDDLQLFLGSNTEEFTGWLHQVLQKLQEVTVASLERKRKSSTGDSEGENLKKEKQRKPSERKKVKRSGEQTRGKDTKDDSENVNQHSGIHKELGKVTKSHSPIDQSVSSSQVQVNKGIRESININESIGKSQARIEKEQDDRISSVSHKLGITKLNDLQVCDESQSSHIIKKESGKLHGDGVNLKSVGKSQIAADSHSRSHEIYSGKSGYRKISIVGKTNTSSKIICSSVDESSNVPESSVMNPIMKGTSDGVEEKAVVHLQPVARPKILLMQSDDDDDEDFINIKADAEAEELLDAELPKETPETSHNGVNSAMKIVSAVLSNKNDVTSVVEDEHNISNVRGLHLSDRLGVKVTSSGSVLDRLGVRKVTALSRESNSPLLRITDRLGEKIIPPMTDRLGNRKVSSLRSNDVMERKDSNQEDKQSNIASRLGARIVHSGLPGERRSISVLPSSERRNISVAQVAPTSVNRISRLMNTKTQTQQVGSKTLRRPQDEEGATDKDQIPRKRPLLSRVVAMRRETVDKKKEEEEEEEYDPANPAVGSVASVVRVKPRPKVPAALQANKNLILKAMAEAQKSVASAPKRIEPYERPDSLYTRKFRDSKGRDKIAITLPNRRVQPQPKESPVNEKPSDIERIVIPVKLEASRSISSVNLQQKIVIQVSSEKPAPQEETVAPPDTMSSKFEEVQEENVTENLISDYEEEITKVIEVNSELEGEETKDEVYDEVQRILAFESPSPWSKDLELENESSVRHPPEKTPKPESVSLPEVSRAESPQFVVTLDGLDPSIFHAHSRKKQQISSIVVRNPSIDSESPAVEYEEKEVSSSEEIQRGKQREKRPASPILYRKSSGSDATGSTTDALKQKINERCKYWPACRSGDKCDYLHPTIPCKSFPSCKFGDKCLYIHPNCKFDASCTRRDCPFTHASPRNMSSSTSSVTTRARTTASTGRASQQVCTFFPKCSNVNCRYLHPKPCRYGRYCSRKTECTFLHEDIPSADKLKWVCPFRF